MAKILITSSKDLNVAIQDVTEGAKKWELWVRLGVDDMRRRYRRTFLGPFWHSLSMAIFVISSGILFSTLWNMKIAEYLPFLCSGMIAWLPISAIMTESCSSFIGATGVLTQIRMPYSVFIISTVWRNLLLFFHHFVIYAFLVLIFKVPVNLNSILILVGLASLILNGFWMALVIAVLSTRYRDIQPLISSFLQIIMFVTPVFWPPSLLEGRRIGLMFVHLNPFYHLIQSIRMPLMGQRPDISTYIGIAVIAILGWSAALYLLSKYRNRIAYWL